MSNTRPGYDTVIPQDVRPHELRPRFKAFTTTSFAGLSNAGVNSCRQALCECTQIDQIERADFDSSGTLIQSIIHTTHPTSTDFRENGTVWIAFKPGTSVGGMWLRCGLVWKFIASIRSKVLNESEPFYRALWNLKGEDLAFGNRQSAGSAYGGFSGRSYPNAVCNPTSDGTQCNSYSILGGLGYDAFAVNQKGTLNEGAVNRASVHANGTCIGTGGVDNSADISIGVVSVPIVIPSLPQPDGTVPGYYFPVVNGVQQSTKVAIPIQSANYIAKNPFISRYVQYRIKIPDGQPVPIDAVRFLYLNNKIIPWIKGGLRNGTNRGVNYYNTPGIAARVSTHEDGTVGHEGTLIPANQTYSYFYNTSPHDFTRATPTHVSMELSPIGGSVWAGGNQAIPSGTTTFHRNITYAPTQHEKSVYGIDSECFGVNCHDAYYRDGDIVVQYYSHARGAPGLYSDGALFDTMGISAFTESIYPRRGNTSCHISNATTSSGARVGISAPDGIGPIVHMALLKFRPRANTFVYQGGVVYTPDTRGYALNIGISSYIHAYFMAPANNADQAAWNLASRPSIHNNPSTGGEALTTVVGLCAPATNEVLNTNAFGVFNPNVPSVDLFTEPPHPQLFTGNLENAKVGFSLHSKTAINNFGVSFYHNPRTIGIQELGRGENGFQLEILHPGSPHYLPLDTLKIVMARGVFTNNPNINYEQLSPYKGPTGALAEKTFGQWLLDEMVDVQNQPHLPLSVGLAP